MNLSKVTGGSSLDKVSFFFKFTDKYSLGVVIAYLKEKFNFR